MNTSYKIYPTIPKRMHIHIQSPKSTSYHNIWIPRQWTVHAPKYFQLIMRVDDGPGRLATDSTNTRENRPWRRGMSR